MKFIIHSLHLLDEALAYEDVRGVKCYIPGRDTPQTNGDEILPTNLQAMAACDEDVVIIWDGETLGSMFDMGMAYALGKTLVPTLLRKPIRASWVKYYESKMGTTIRHP